MNESTLNTGATKDEATFSTGITLTKREIIKYGLRFSIEPMVESIKYMLEDTFTDLVSEDLKEIGNSYQLVMTLKKIEEPQ